MLVRGERKDGIKRGKGVGGWMSRGARREEIDMREQEATCYELGWDNSRGSWDMLASIRAQRQCTDDSAVAYRALIQSLFPHGKRLSFTLSECLSTPLSHKITQFLFLSISLPLISLLSSLVSCYPINSFPQCLSSLVLIIKLDLLQVAGGKTNSQCRHQTDNALQLTFVFSITCGLGNERRIVHVTLRLPRRHKQKRTHKRIKCKQS